MTRSYQVHHKGKCKQMTSHNKYVNMNGVDWWEWAGMVLGAWHELSLAPQLGDNNTILFALAWIHVGWLVGDRMLISHPNRNVRYSRKQYISFMFVLFIRYLIYLWENQPLSDSADSCLSFNLFLVRNNAPAISAETEMEFEWGEKLSILILDAFAFAVVNAYAVVINGIVMNCALYFVLIRKSLK